MYVYLPEASHSAFGSHLNSFAPSWPPHHPFQVTLAPGQRSDSRCLPGAPIGPVPLLEDPTEATEAHRLTFSGAFISKKSGFSLSKMSCTKIGAKIGMRSVWWVLCRCWKMMKMLIETKSASFTEVTDNVEVLDAFSALKVMLRAYRFSVFWCGLRMFEEKVVTFKGVCIMHEFRYSILFTSYNISRSYYAKKNMTCRF